MSGPRQPPEGTPAPQSWTTVSEGRQPTYWTNPHWVRALMHFPDDTPEHRERREQYCGILTAQTLKRIGLLGEAESRAVINAAVDGLAAVLTETAKRGIVAGDVLFTLYGMAMGPWRDQIPEPSIGKAIDIVSKFSAIETYPDQSPLPRSDPTIRACISNFRAVAHLWAAFRLHHQYPMRPHRELFDSAEGLRDFLGIARSVQAFGLAFTTKHGEQRPVFTAEEIWLVPDNQGPMLIPPWPPEMPEWIAGAVQSYSARKR